MDFKTSTPKEIRMSSNTTKDATRFPADKPTLGLVKKLVNPKDAPCHNLKGSEIAVFLTAGKMPDWTGDVKITSELEWLLTGGVDIIVQLNRELFEEASIEARLGHLRNQLSHAHAKATGKTHQTHAGGQRQLYGRRKPKVGLDVATIREVPAFVESVPILRELKRAFEGEQLSLLDDEDMADVLPIKKTAAK
jgi:hypothetical protein